ncbi:capsule biosynthesis GfcC family protein [Paraglaciecola sp. 2405UD69-4]|uniref:capsule biosynthesis GfcC family protein n=1 Tax=Paraglaciecola sp. 2405UD69-4 TaxID=3391836 RepID=UPI0039C99384
MKILLFVFTLSWASFNFAAVKVTINDTTYTYDTNPRLSEVLEVVALQRPWYWQAAALFRLDKGSLEQDRSLVIEQLNELISSKGDSKIISDLIIDIKSWRLAPRVFIPIDYDLSRVQPKFNPKFDDGEYLLLLKERPTTISVLGMITNPTAIDYQDNVTVKDYVSKINRTDLSDKSLIYIIQNDGQISKSGIAYWNNNYDQVMPGSQLFIPISESQFISQISTLNMKIAKLATNRVYK